jgi:hypothetical protein
MQVILNHACLTLYKPYNNKHSEYFIIYYTSSMLNIHNVMNIRAGNQAKSDHQSNVQKGIIM